VRSITRVDAKLLAGSRLRFVATATSGTDHLDLDWLAGQGIKVVDAAGCNAPAVADYVMAALADLQQALSGRRVAVIGAGHVGRRLLHALLAAGADCVACDPLIAPLSGALASVPMVSLEQALQADIISLHVPLSETGPHATRNLLDATRIRSLASGCVLINTARGEVLDLAALKQRVLERGDITAVLDVFPDEPEIDRSLCRLLPIVTPHIAGYSRSAKQSATRRVLAAFCAHFELPMFEPMLDPALQSGPPGGALPPEVLALMGEAGADAAPAPTFSPRQVSARFCQQVAATPPDIPLTAVFDGMRRELAWR